MVRFACRSCGAEGELEFGRQAGDFWCGTECRQKFFDVVVCLEKGKPVDVDCGSRLFREALREVEAHRRAELIYRREILDREWTRTKPRPCRALYPC